MPRIVDTVAVCRTDLFTAEDELSKRYDAVLASRIVRLRDMYMYKLQYPDCTDRKFVEEIMARHNVCQRAAYSDLSIIKQLLPLLTSSSRDYHRWRANEMAMETYKLAKERNDTKTMAQVVKHYADINRVSLEDEQVMPYDDIVPQPFTATSDPTVLGIKPIPNIQQKIKEMIAKYRAETIDIEDVEAEEVDLNEDIFSQFNIEEEDGEA